MPTITQISPEAAVAEGMARWMRTCRAAIGAPASEQWISSNLKDCVAEYYRAQASYVGNDHEERVAAAYEVVRAWISAKSR